MLKLKLLNQSMQCKNKCLLVYHRNLLNKLFKKYKHTSVTEDSYDYGKDFGDETVCTWQDLAMDGVWGYTELSTRKYIFNLFRDFKYHLKYNKRLYISLSEDEDSKTYLYIYSRDICGTDFHILFYNEVNDLRKLSTPCTVTKL